MKSFQSVYINGSFLKPHGTETQDIISPINGEVIGRLTYADETDTQQAIAAAGAALVNFQKTSITERKEYFKRIHDEILKRIDDLIEATTLEYGAAKDRAKWSNMISATTFQNQIAVLENYPFEKTVNESTVIMEAIGVAALFTPWNSVSGSIAVKIAAALAAGCTIVLKPSEFGPWQAQIIMECIDAAGLPNGVVNMVNGRGDIISRAIMESTVVNKVSFTGSTVVGKILGKQAIDTMKRVTLELGGKSANIILDDANLNTAIPMAVQACFMNNGQACIAGSRLFVPEEKLDEVKRILLDTAAQFKVGDPSNEDVKMGPVASQKQYDRIQQFIAAGIEDGAEVLFGGLGRPEGLENGYYVKPTIFTGATNEMQIAREEIFGPVLSVISYKSEEEAIAMANDSDYGLMAYVSSADIGRAKNVAGQLKAGRVLVNTLKHDPFAPFGGYKNSGFGRENGSYGLEEFLEAKTLIA
ncbi:aldehyde dehydrogenase family protein [Mucilaginibacter sp. BJC16-A38]|uniref:aldehyde dehydrogenase family protein n=1 Tax=Mucilaginibacter phenanthrenivorans TaxID=1234842 RepID=UPI0021573263|nr:aldehyde dehydrogenase family protein [Mucilaginibacter phenanthrenivorans]MCR8557354.1 aldehyde dehydrogenase family protein [Mucilaginibacter phenanthrenivorans]